MLIAATTPGCSLIFTKGPQPELHPPPECTASVAAPVTDTVLATLSVALLGLGVAGVVDSNSTRPCTPNSSLCSFGNGTESTFSWGAVVAGAALGALFTASAVVGYQRTSACRASREPNALLQQPRAALLRASPVEACVPVSDAPRVCARAVLLPGGGPFLASHGR